jgi:hypothetical protein
MEFFQTVALLCQLAGSRTQWIEERQLKCQQYYLQCVAEKQKQSFKIRFNALKECIMEKK